MFGKRNEAPHTIGATLKRSNNALFAKVVGLIVLLIIALVFIWVCAQSVNEYSAFEKEAYDCLLDIQAWAIDVEDYLDGNNQTLAYGISYGQDRNTQCIEKVRKRSQGTLPALLESNNMLITEVTNYLQMCLDEPDREKALDIYNQYAWKSMEQLQDNLAQIGSAFANMVLQSNAIVSAAITLSILAAVLVTLITLIKASLDCKKTSASITGPINVVADLAEDISQGSTDLSAIDKIDFENLTLDEARSMLTAFRSMATSLAQNVDVVKRVADGDMTAFVNIRSTEDALGKSVYKMVQNNDMMFAHVAEIAGGVAEQIGYIAQANGSLAEGCTRQAQIVTDFVEKIDSVSDLIMETSQKTDDCVGFANSVKTEVTVSTEKMGDLRNAMEEIKTASEKISAVIENIEQIASRTNLLSLNASIEAARAGEAGRGFAVVATSIGELARQSAELSQESKKLIEDTVSCTARGSVIADDTFETFGVMNKSIDDIVAATGEIAERSAMQKDHMEALKGGLAEISDTVTQNAAASEETASMSDEIIRNSKTLQESISQFTLRQRIEGQPYIPPEKANDPEFIKEATENYNRYKQTQKYAYSQ